ncbi:MAG: hypothetical protein HFG95_13745 [Dorea sp.]|nr:hypothetical protein [Dorea sp.]
MKRVEKNEIPLIHSLKKKIEKDGKLCDKSLLKMNTWKKFNYAVRNKKVILYGAGEMFTYFCKTYGMDYDILYAVDRSTSSDRETIKSGVNVYPVEKLSEEQTEYVILITPVNGIDEIFAELKKRGTRNCFSFSIMEYRRTLIRFKIWLARNWKSYTIKYQQEMKIRTLEQQIENLVQRLEYMDQKINSMQQRMDGIQQRQTERYLYLLHTNQVMNVLIDKTNDIELKKEQMRYTFTHIHKNSYIPDLNNPKSFNEKILYMTLYDHNPLYTEVSDKLQFKKYVAERVGEKYVVPLLGVWNEPEEVDFEVLPRQFVLKSTRGGDSQKVVIVQDKDKIDKDELIRIMKPWKEPYNNEYYYNFNWPFKNMEFKVFAEEYLPIDELNYFDFKVHCFHGEPKYIHVVSLNPHEVTYYDLNWNKQDFWRCYPPVHYNIPKPDCLNEILDLSRKLAESFSYVRVDFYVMKDKLYLGELTLTSFGALAPFEPTEIDFEWGKLL